MGRPPSGFGEEGNMIICFKETRDLFLGINLGNKLLRDISTTKRYFDRKKLEYNGIH